MSNKHPMAFQSSSGRKERTPIVVADDDPDQLDEICDYLRRHGYDVVGASDGHSALAAIKVWQPRVALIDVNMPNWDGIRVAEVAGTFDHKLSLLLMSGDSEAVVRAHQAHTNAFAVIEKPLAMDHVVRFIDATLIT